MTLADRLKDPAFRMKVKHAGIRLDFEDQRWMMERIEELEAERDAAVAALGQIRVELNVAKIAIALVAGKTP